MSPSPYVGVLHQRETKGWTGADAELVPAEVMTLEAALTRQWPVDAHVLQYQIVDAKSLEPVTDGDGPVIYRINKEALCHIRDRGGELLVTFLAFDWDTEEHKPWMPGEYQAFIERVFSFIDLPYNLPAKPTALYASRNGARFIYQLTRPVKAEIAEGLALGIIRDFQTCGILLDVKCFDWTRCYRLPSVTRDGIPTWEEPSFDFNYFPDNLLDPSTVAPGLRTAYVNEYAPAEGYLGLMPTPEECDNLLWEVKSNKRVPTLWHKRAKERLIGRVCYDVAFLEKPIGEPGVRNQRIQQLTGEACAMLHPLHGTAPPNIMALFAPAVQQLEGDQQTPDWYRSCWNSIVRYWNKEEMKQEARNIQKKSRELVTDEKVKGMVTGMRKWCARPELYQESEEAVMEWAKQHAIAAHGQTYFVMTPQGFYDRLPVNGTQLQSRVRELGMDDIIEFEIVTPNGRKEVPTTKVLRRHATNIACVVGCVDTPYNYIENIEDNNATLRFQLFQRRRDLEPAHAPVVEEWLRSWCESEEDYQRLINWIGHALAFEDGPICALSLAGPPGCGKKLFVQGLAECISTEAIATDADFGTFNSGLLNSPFLVINEGLPKQLAGGRDIADLFRHYVSGDPIVLNQKFKEPILVKNPLRLVCTANNEDILANLCGHRDLSPEDRDAILTRILHIQISARAGQYLRARGGLAYTGRAGERWIRSDGGAASDYILAKHFLWLWKNRQPAPAGHRLLVEGRLGPEQLQRVATQSGSSPHVIEAVVRMNEVGTRQAVWGYHANEDGIWVTVNGVIQEYTRQARVLAMERLSVRQVTSVLRSIMVRAENRAFNKQNAKWYLIDQRMLLGCAIEQGIACTALMNRVGLPQLFNGTIANGV